MTNRRGLYELGAALCLTAALGGSALAAENGVVNYAPGASSTTVGLFPPIPGLFYLNQLAIQPSGTVRNGKGRPLPGPIEVGSVFNTSRFIANYGVQVLGANLYSQLVLPVVNLNTTAFRTFKDDDFGLSNVSVSPFILDWKLSPLQNVVLGLDIATTLGTPITRNGANVKLGYTSFQPVLAYRYLQPNGFTAGISNRFLLNLKDDLTGYHSGGAYEADFEAGWLFGKFKVTAAGYFVNQFEDDRQFGRRVPGGNRLRSLAVGPAVQYDFGPAILTVNYQRAIIAENTVKSDTVWVNVAIPLYVPPGAPPIPPGSPRDIVASRAPASLRP